MQKLHHIEFDKDYFTNNSVNNIKKALVELHNDYKSLCSSTIKIILITFC